MAQNIKQTSKGSKKPVQKNEGSVNITDIFFYLLSYWYIFVLSVAICFGYALYKFSRTPYVYQSSATIVIKDPSNTKSSARLDTYNNLINRTNVSNEILQFRSKRLMTEVVQRLGANVSYTCKVKFRTAELYKGSPVSVLISDELAEYPFEIKVSPKSDSTLLVRLGENERLLTFNDTISISGGRVAFFPSSHFAPVWIDKEITITHLSAAVAAQRFLGGLNIVQKNEDASILSFSMVDSSPDRARDILNTLFVVYNEDSINDKNQVAVNTAQFINERLAIIGEDLGSVEDKLQSFKTEHRIMDANDAANRYLNQTETSNARIVEIETRLRLAEYIKEYLTDPVKLKEMIPTNTGLEDLRIEGLINQYNSVKMQRDRLSQDAGDSSPVIVGIDATLASMRRSIISSIDNLVVSMNVKKADEEMRESVAYSKFAEMPTTARQMLSIERQQNIKESLYLYLLNKREENALSQSMVDNNARVVDYAESSWFPVSPNRNKMLLLGILAGLLFPAVILLGRLLLDNKVRTRKEVEEAVGIPVIGEIPVAYKKKKGSARLRQQADRVLYYDKNSKGLLTEAFRILCTNIDIMCGDPSKSHVLTVSSFNVSAGKTFTAINIAACFADNKKKVVLVDMDLRKRTTSRHFGIAHKTKGVSNYLYDSHLEVEEIIKHNVVPGIDMVPAGMIPPNPVELLRRDRLESLIDDLKARYDYVLVDNVPIDVVADPVIINRVIDTTIFVVRAGTLDRRLLPQLQEIYDEDKLNNLCIVVNGTEITRHYGGYGYGYGYGSGYGYGYAYGYGHGYGEDVKK